MSAPDHIAHPDGVDPADLPADAPGLPERYIARGEGYYRTRRDANMISDTGARRQALRNESKLLPPAADPLNILAGALEMSIAAAVLLAEDFDFGEIYQDLINIIRTEPDPKVRMQAGDRLLKMVRDTLAASGRTAKVVETLRIRSPDGTVADRTTITRRLQQTLEGASRVPSQADHPSPQLPPTPGTPEDPPTPNSTQPPGTPGPAETPSPDGRDGGIHGPGQGETP